MDYEVAIYVRSKTPGVTGNDRTQEGDIVCIRPPSPGIGLKEMTDFVWLRIGGVDRLPLVDPTEFEKRRFQIPLDRLAQVVPGFNPAMARDTSLVYQPFLLVDDETGFYLVAGPVLDFHGLVFDKLTGVYL